MSKEITWNSIHDIILQYHQLDETQGLKIYYKTIDFDNEEIVIISQIIPYGFDYDTNFEVPIINPKRRMANYVNQNEFITWHVYNKEFTICLNDITKIEIIDNAIDKIMDEILEDEKQG